MENKMSNTKGFKMEGSDCFGCVKFDVCKFQNALSQTGFYDVANLTNCRYFKPEPQYDKPIFKKASEL